MAEALAVRAGLLITWLRKGIVKCRLLLLPAGSKDG
jgi:hypothetical protein